MVSRPTFIGQVLRGMDEFMAAYGMDFATTARDVGIDLDIFDNEDVHVPMLPVLRLFEAGAARSGDDAFGLRFAHLHHLRSAGLAHYVMINSPTLRDALTARTRLIRLSTNALSPYIDERDRVGFFCWNLRPDLGPIRQF